MPYVVPVSFSGTVKSVALMFLLALVAACLAEEAFHHAHWRHFAFGVGAAVVFILLGLGNVMFLAKITSAKS